MKYLVESGTIAMLRNLVAALIPFAQAQQVALYFQANLEFITLPYQPEKLCVVLTSLICRIIAYTPKGESVGLNVTLIKTSHSNYLMLQIQNSGIDLSRTSEITKSCKYPISVYYNEMGGTTYELHWQMERQQLSFVENHFSNAKILPQIKGFYVEIRKRIRSHFTHSKSRMSFMVANNSQDAIFLQKVDAVILAHLDDETFDANHLSKSLAMSRAQLFRRFKSIIRESPALYIRYFRLQKAKEMLETTAYSIGEIAFKTGFQSQSHFTRIFKKRFGTLPSTLRPSGNKE